MKTGNENESLDDYLNNIVSKYPIKTKISFSDKYEKTIAYEIIDKTMYQDVGGGHMYMIGIERTAPKYPGLLLENPVTLPKGSSDNISYYKASNSKNRFSGSIFYLVMLDSSEDINEQSLSVL